jgi:hypothetical protein
MPLWNIKLAMLQEQSDGEQAVWFWNKSVGQKTGEDYCQAVYVGTKCRHERRQLFFLSYMPNITH